MRVSYMMYTVSSSLALMCAHVCVAVTCVCCVCVVAANVTTVSATAIGCAYTRRLWSL